jgi:hypothetical protein
MPSAVIHIRLQRRKSIQMATSYLRNEFFELHALSQVRKINIIYMQPVHALFIAEVIVIDGLFFLLSG